MYFFVWEEERKKEKKVMAVLGDSGLAFVKSVVMVIILIGGQ